MSDSKWQDELGPIVRSLQIIVGSLIASCVVFLVIVLVTTGGKVAAGGQPLLRYMAVVFAVTALIARLVVPGILIASTRRKIIRGTWRQPQFPAFNPTLAAFLERTGDAGKLAMVFQTSSIVGAALLEGPAFFALIVYLVEQSPLSLILAGVLILGLATHLPTRSRVIHWIEDQLVLLQQERQLGG